MTPTAPHRTTLSALMLASALAGPLTAQVMMPSNDAAQRLHFGGNAAFEYAHGQKDAAWASPNGGFLLRQFQGVVDADVTDKVGLIWEIDVLKEAQFQSGTFTNVLYLQIDDILNKSWLRARLGLIPIPYGMEYELNYYPINNPLASYTVGSPYGYDVGAELFGTVGDGRLSYQAAVLNGSDSVNARDSKQQSYALRLVGSPADGVRIALSGLTTGRQGSDASGIPGATAFEWAGTNASGKGSTLEVTVDAAGADLVLERKSFGRIWLSGGLIGVRRPADVSGAPLGRTLHYYSAELLKELPASWFAAARFSSIASNVRNGSAETMQGFNGWDAGSLNGAIRRIDRISAGVGYRWDTRATVKVEITADKGYWADAPTGGINKNYAITQVAFKF